MTTAIDPELGESLRAYLSVVGDRGVGGITELRERREVHAALARRAAAAASPLPVAVTDHEIAGPAQSPAVQVRLYVPSDAEQRRGSAWVYIHGGGMTLGDVRTSDLAAANLAVDSGCVVLSVGYRLAPETVFPGPLDDCAAALAWLHAQAGALDIDENRIGVYGVSAGGALAAALALRSRDGLVPPLAGQVLIYPMLDDRTSVRPVTPDAPRGTWSHESNANAWQMYLGPGVDRDALPPYAVPGRAGSLVGLPRTYLDVGSVDVLAVEVVDYAARLISAGVPTEAHVYPGAYHAFDAIAATSALAISARTNRLRAMAAV